MAKWKIPEGRKMMTNDDLSSLAGRLADTNNLEAKLEMAIETLNRIAEGCEANYPPSHSAIKNEARAALAELKGETE